MMILKIVRSRLIHDINKLLNIRSSCVEDRILKSKQIRITNMHFVHYVTNSVITC